MNASSGCAVVTGGARGIGLAIAERITSEGGRVLIGDVDIERAARVSEQLGERCSYVEWDVADEDATIRAFSAAAEGGAPVDRVFVNAGFVGVVGPIERTQRMEWDETLGVLLTGAFLTIKHAVAVMRPRGRGSIVCTASVASVRGGLGPHAYTAAKSGLRGLVESVAVEVAPYGLRINAVAPGEVASSLSAGLFGGDPDDVDLAERQLAEKSSAGRATTAGDVAAAAIFLAGPDASRINGSTLVIDGGDAVLGSSGRHFFSLS